MIINYKDYATTLGLFYNLMKSNNLCILFFRQKRIQYLCPLLIALNRFFRDKLAIGLERNDRIMNARLHIRDLFVIHFNCRSETREHAPVESYTRFYKNRISTFIGERQSATKFKSRFKMRIFDWNDCH